MSVDALAGNQPAIWHTSGSMKLSSFGEDVYTIFAYKRISSFFIEKEMSVVFRQSAIVGIERLGFRFSSRSIEATVSLAFLPLPPGRVTESAPCYKCEGETHPSPQTPDPKPNQQTGNPNL